VALLKVHKDALIEAIKADDHLMALARTLNLDDLADLAAKAMLKRTSTVLETTGLVLTGFGEKEFFPALEQYTCYGFVLGRMVCEAGETVHISQENVSEVVPFAQSEMSKGFMYGAQPSVMSQMDTGVVRALDHFEDSLRKGKHLKASAKVDDLREKAHDEFAKELARELGRSHTAPMRRVVGMLPIDELAELAEILVRVESLKERVTRDTESVSGPIDVAIISKGDGFIWIKRKHYFDPRLNPRFFTRRGMTPHV
jgi:hypothetical protein